jgi:hypothetical protein
MDNNVVPLRMDEFVQLAVVVGKFEDVLILLVS